MLKNVCICTIDRCVYVLWVMGLVQSEICRRCNEEEETPLHLITECPALIEDRAKIFNTRIMATNDVKNMKLEDIFKFIIKIRIEV